MILIAMLLSGVVHATATHPLLNDREGKSFLLSNSNVREVERLNIPSLAQELNSVVAGLGGGEACAFSLNTALILRLPAYPMLRGNHERFLQAIRHQGLIDDVVLQLLQKAHGVHKDIDHDARDQFAPPAGDPPAELRPFRDFSTRRGRGKCLHDNFRELMSGFRQQNRDFTVSELRRRIDPAVRAGYLTEKAASELRAALSDKIEEWQVSLADYVSKKQFLRTQFPVVGSERADFVTSKAGKTNNSHRLKLYQTYTPIQITLMGDVIKKLKSRLESPRIEILVYDNSDEVREVISLDPMERFRFAIRLLRKEMRLLSTNSYFTGRQPSYTDLMASAYEIGGVTALELDQVARLEEIWNPTRTFWDKAAVWVRMFGGVLSVVVPPPYGFLPALAITAIEAVTRDQPNDDTDSLF